MLRNDRDFKYHPKCSKLKITHLIFADDLLLFSYGDLNSVQKILQIFQKFSKISGLEANQDKCSIYFGGVDDTVKGNIMHLLNFSEGTLPIRYLGVPLICKRLTYEDCTSLISKVTDQFQTWNKNKNLTYAGRLQVIKSVILGIQIYWTSNYILPIKVSRKIDELCRLFLWGNSGYSSGTPLVSWARLLKARDKAVQYCGGVENLIQLLNSCTINSKLQVSAVYHAISPVTYAVPWHITVWDKRCYPKHAFICWLAVQNKLLTQDRLLRRGIINENVCCLCSGGNLESRDHLFFDCNFSREIWNNIMDWLQFSWKSCDWNLLMNWFCTRLRGNSFKHGIKRMALSAAIYRIWCERNARIFQSKTKGVEQLANNIKMDILINNLNNSILEEDRVWLLSL
ncbi:uncharacterized protein LOC109834980 [Asparagus officinalis]|uniref:uncharacterized protein LOC109834980 n=1 Tax=Asparagus officinalis TaxID=4686 RepID=UPI00098E6AF3|nr:uncharacterized protein LOC109834980 [Asparagus officinalis]